MDKGPALGPCMLTSLAQASDGVRDERCGNGFGWCTRLVLVCTTFVGGRLVSSARTVEHCELQHMWTQTGLEDGFCWIPVIRWVRVRGAVGCCADIVQFPVLRCTARRADSGHTWQAVTLGACRTVSPGYRYVTDP